MEKNFSFFFLKVRHFVYTANTIHQHQCSDVKILCFLFSYRYMCSWMENQQNHTINIYIVDRHFFCFVCLSRLVNVDHLSKEYQYKSVKRKNFPHSVSRELRKFSFFFRVFICFFLRKKLLGFVSGFCCPACDYD